MRPPSVAQTLNGEQALGLSRSRHAYDDYGGGDFYRAANQRMILMAIAKKVLKLDPAAMASAVTPGHYFEVFERSAKAGIPTVYLCFPAALSSSFYAAQVLYTGTG